MRAKIAAASLTAVLSPLCGACLTQANLPARVTVENIRRIQVGMTRAEVEDLLGPPIEVERPAPHIFGPDAEVMVYFHRVSAPIHYPMLWVHLRAGSVEEVYAKHHNIADSDGVYALSKQLRWESPRFIATFPLGSPDAR